VSSSRYGRYLGALGLIVVIGLIVRTVFVSPVDPSGISPGHRLPPFATPLARGGLSGDADIATHADDGEDGKVPACAERGAQILNICQLYEQGPVVLALFVDSASCTSVLSHMQALSAAFPRVRFAAVAIRVERSQVRALMRERGLTLPIGLDPEGAVAALYKVLTCPQVNFAYRGGVIQSKALLGDASPASLRSRVSALAAASRAREARQGGSA
jgi:predicted amino acid-binding ACT domain protein